MHLLECHREKQHQNLLVVRCGLLQFLAVSLDSGPIGRVMSPETDSGRILFNQTYVLRQMCGGHGLFVEGIKGLNRL